MNSIKEYQEAFADAAKKKFPKNVNWTQKDRLLSMQRQLADIGAAIQKEEGIYDHKSIHNTANHCVANLLADLLLLADDRRIDLDEELELTLEWFQSDKNLG